MSDDLSAIDELHDELFDDRPRKAGTRLERIVGLVIASRSAGQVSVQQQHRRPRRRAGHWIDVDEVRPGGGLHIIECKHWSELVDQDVLNSVASRRDQLAAVAATVVSVRGFTAGAMDVAHDESIELVRMSRLAPDEHRHGVVKELRARGTMTASDVIELHWETVDKVAMALAIADDPQGAVWERDPLEMRVEDAEGNAAESVGDLLATVPSSSVPGTYEHRVVLPEVRYHHVGAVRLAVSALCWKETITKAPFEFTVGPKSPGIVLVQTVTAVETVAVRVVMDHELRAWRLTDERKLVPIVDPPSALST